MSSTIPPRSDVLTIPKPPVISADNFNILKMLQEVAVYQTVPTQENCKIFAKCKI